MKYWYFAVIFLIFLLFLSYQSCKIQKTSKKVGRKLFCSHPEIYASILTLAFAVYMYKLR